MSGTNIFGDITNEIKDITGKIGQGAKAAAQSVAEGAKDVATATVKSVKNVGNTVADETLDVIGSAKAKQAQNQKPEKDA